KIIESQMNDRFRDSFYVYEETLKKEGKDKLDQLASGCSYDHKVSIRTHKIAGVNLPLVDVEAEKMSLQYSTIHTSSRIDGTMEKFINILSLVAEMAETINSVIRLSKELKKTQRRVNALEKVLIPDHRDNIRMIEERLESDIRDEFFVKKLLKKRK
ncbi:MAG: V-type ATP synthase subunit D, partial [Actinomycetia bacterium]|nr:V-type ATP synthase subunit D [Actinomycetes bacterium]